MKLKSSLYDGKEEFKMSWNNTR